jgi:hypothetical protein
MEKKSFDLSSLLSGVLSLLSSKYSPAEKEEKSAPPKIQSSIAGSVLSVAQADLGVHEDLGHNDGKRIRQYFKMFGTTAGKEWCAAAVSFWLKEAGFSAVSGSMGARNLGDQFKEAGLWAPKGKVTPDDLVPGNIAVWSRGGSGKGHVGVISSSSGDSFSSIEANSGPNSDSVVINKHSIGDGNLLGIGLVSAYGSAPQSLAARVDLLVRLAK